MQAAFCLLALYAQQKIPEITAESLSGQKVSLPAAAQGQPALLIVGFTHASQTQTQTRAWSQRARNLCPVWSIAVLEDVPRLVRGMAVHGIKSGTPKEEHGRFLLVYHGEKELKAAAGFEQPDDAYLLAIDGAGAIRWRYHGPPTDAAAEQLRGQCSR